LQAAWGASLIPLGEINALSCTQRRDTDQAARELQHLVEARGLEACDFNETKRGQTMDATGILFASTLKRLGGDLGLFEDLAEFYREDSPALLQEIRNGLESADIDRVQRAAHRLRSMLENFDVERAVTITRTIEQT
jgi:HPt (histidine-containing phosphotransfer) domain-containing protein